MAATRNSGFDDPFYQPADKFFPANNHLGLTFDDITLATLYSEILPRDTQLDTTLAENLHLNIPAISSDMDTVTESRMASSITICRSGSSFPKSAA
jgi:IMP dehydrogenase